VVHPHHPMNGQRFKLVTYRHNWGEDRVYFHDRSGTLRSIPACWTDDAASRSIRSSGRTSVPVSLRGFVEADRLAGEAPVNLGSIKCKYNNAAYVNRIMPAILSGPTLGDRFMHYYLNKHGP
jgi:hypothetical protein